MDQNPTSNSDTQQNSSLPEPVPPQPMQTPPNAVPTFQTNSPQPSPAFVSSFSPAAQTQDSVNSNVSYDDTIRPVTMSSDGTPKGKFPFLAITLVIIFIVTGFSASFLYFKFASSSSRIASAPIITPPVKVMPTDEVVENNSTGKISTDSANPFDETAEYENPFSVDDAGDSQSSDAQAYKNPFENLE